MILLRVMESRGKVARKEVSPSDWHVRKLTQAAEQRMIRKGETRGWEASEETAMIQGRIGAASVKIEVGGAGRNRGTKLPERGVASGTCQGNRGPFPVPRLELRGETENPGGEARFRSTIRCLGGTHPRMSDGRLGV